ncbi:hypothetical protein [Microbacterium elymi]|uniref:NmrA-like domain-containing protein n=1 Tax=Microbacterium elymi TaxID=2909587 RepID=A0ABY5NLH3_9MICO|nr:hypothetical protein [Microbacterium elymi]UUT36034.1 hypothetical protein L2X98_23315 [Microbacterium elymi]
MHATQFFEFVRSIAEQATVSGITHAADVLIQPMAADDVAAAVAAAVRGGPAQGIVENAGPEVFELRELLSRDLRFRSDPRQVVADPLGTYFGAALGREDLLPGADARLSTTRFAQWQEGTR